MNAAADTSPPNAAALQARPATAKRILDVAERLVQTRGFNSFSYADIAAELGITNAAIHYHFKCKEHLGVRLLERYRERFFSALAKIRDDGANAAVQLDRYTSLYEQTAAGGRMCLCGILTAQLDTLPASITVLVYDIMEQNEAWLAQTLTEGRELGHLAFPGEPGPTAAAFAAMLQGALLLARTRGGVEQFKVAAAAGAEALYQRATER